MISSFSPLPLLFVHSALKFYTYEIMLNEHSQNSYSTSVSAPPFNYFTNPSSLSYASNYPIKSPQQAQPAPALCSKLAEANWNQPRW